MLKSEYSRPDGPRVQPIHLHAPLAQADLGFRRTLRRAAGLMQSGAIVNAVACVIGVVSMLAFFFPVLSLAGTVLNIGLSLVGVALTSSGWWALAAPEPGAPAAGAMSCRWVRLAQVLPLVPCLLLGAALLRYLRDPEDWTIPAMMGGVGLVLLVLFPAIGFFAGIGYLTVLARRLDDRELQQRIRTMAWSVPLLMTVGACLLVGPIGASVVTWRVFARFKRDLDAIEREEQDRAVRAVKAA